VPPYDVEQGGCVCNIAIARHAAVNVSAHPAGVVIDDEGTRHEAPTAADFPREGGPALAKAALRRSGVRDVVLATRSHFPAGAGLGGSSAVGVALVAALCAWRGESPDRAAIAERSRAVDARDEFLAIASHELRTPLTALLLRIQGELRILRQDGADRGRDEMIRRLEATERMAQRLANLIGELLEVSRIIWGRFEPEREDVDLGALVQASVARQEQQLAHAGCQVRVQVEGAVQGCWDRGRLDGVLDNLIGNAAKYGAGKPIEVRVRGNDHHVVLEVRDHGIGIDPADHARIFERFERAVSSRHFGGFGLGLWISRKVVEAHGGRISLTSEPGTGSTFSVVLPRTSNA
jgi:signal transduction histidine kinase